MESNPRDNIRIKYGAAEFETSGAPDDVKARYDAFLELVKAMPAPPASDAKPATQPAQQTTTPPTDPVTSSGNGAEPQVSPEIMARVFRQTGNTVSLLALPRGQNSVAEACLMLLYGFATLASTPAVTGVTLMEACRQSGVQVDRLDRVMSAQHEYVNAGGARRGRRYSLNNPGTRRAAELVSSLV